MSTTFQSSQNQNQNQIAVTAPPTSPQHQQNNNPRLRLLPGDVCVGCVVWLPPYKSRNAAIHCTKLSCAGEELGEGGYHHPVVVLRIRQREDSRVLGDLICTVAFMSTFGNTSLTRYTARKAKDPRFRYSMPVYQQTLEDEVPLSQPALDSNVLYLEKRNLKKQGYVKYDHTYDIPVQYLRTYGYRGSHSRAYKFRLREESYRRLMRKLGLPNEVFELTNTLFETENTRLTMLAAPEASAPAPRIWPDSERLPFVRAIADVPVTDHVVIAREESYQCAAIRREPLTRIVLPPVQQRRLPVYVNRWPNLRPDETSSEEEGAEISWVKFGVYVVALIVVGFLVGWFWT